MNTCSGTSFDTKLWIYGTDGTTELAYNDDDCGLQSRVTMTTPANGVYYFDVGPFGSSTGHYDVILIGATSLTPPGYPEYADTPSPTGINVPVNGSLTWDWGMDTETYDLWFGPQGSMVEVVTGGTAGADGTQGSYVYTNLNTTAWYEWQLILHNSTTRFTTTGMIWSFMTACGDIVAYPYVQDFEFGGQLDPCWAQGTGDQRNWTIHTGSTSSTNTGPSGDHTTGTGYYAYLETSSGVAGDQAHLLSPIFDLSALSAPTLEFYYHMYGATMGTLAVDVYNIGTSIWTDNVWTLSGDQGNQWSLASVGVAAYGNSIQLRFRAVRGASFTGDASIDDIYLYDNTAPPGCSAATYPADNGVDITEYGTATWTSAAGGASGYTIYMGSDGGGVTDPTDVLNGIDAGALTSYDYTGLAYNSIYYWKVVPYNANGDATGCPIWTFTTRIDPTIDTFPFLENFDHAGAFPQWWINETGDDFNWSISTGTTPTGNTGPTADHTDGNGYYAFIESNGPLAGQEAYLQSPVIDLSSLTSPALEFWYHMYGSTIGTLQVDYLDVTTMVWTDNFWSIVGAQGNQWNLASVGMSGLPNNVVLRFRAIVGAPTYSDIAIDDFYLFDNQSAPGCSNLISPSDGNIYVMDYGMLDWANAPGAATGYRLYFGTDGGGTTDPTDVVNGTDLGIVTNYTFTGLNWNTTYYWKVVPYNTNGDATGCPIWSFTVVDDPTIDSFPHLVDFESGQIPNGWTEVMDATNTHWVYQAGGYTAHPASAHGGSFNAMLYYSGSSPHITTLVSPVINLNNITAPEVRFWHTQALWAGDQDELRVLYRNSNTATWTELANYTGSITAWQEEVIALPNPTSTYYLAFEGNAMYGYGVCLDDIEFTGIANVDIDLAANSITGPATARVGIPSTYTIEVLNRGINQESNYTVKLMQEGDIELASVPGTPLDVDATTTFDLIWTPTVDGPTFVWGYVDFPTDMYNGNNTTGQHTVLVEPSQTGIFGNVTDGTAPLDGVQVLIEELVLVEYTDVTGQYVFLGINPGTYTVTASLANYNTVSQPNVVVVLDLLTQVDFVLGQGAMLSGTVSDNAGAPVDAATVSIDGTTETTVTNAQGYYQLVQLTPDTYSVTAEKIGYETQTIDNVVLVQDQTTTLDFTIIEFAQVTVDVTVDYGTADGAIVTFTNEVGTNVYSGTIASGTILLDDILPGTYTLDVTKPMYTPHQETGIAITSGVMTPFSVMLNEEHLPPVNLAMSEAFMFTWDAPGRMFQTQAQADPATQAGVNDKETEQQETTRDLLSYYVFLDGVFEAQTIEVEYQFAVTDFVHNQPCTLSVKAAYDGGDSDLVYLEWTYIDPQGNNNSDVSPLVTALGSNIPNPFNPETAIHYTMNQSGHVVIEIYNAKGQRVNTLVNAVMDAGNHSVVWNGKDANGKSVKSGVFFYRMKTGRYTSTKKMILLK
ncbi:MAG: carboxypeptidase regulatory-like domain-containing protein [Candidatus Cloacimonetes bacterium]|nr:carboxypeptidase regulatory-like domain-containing protein [Candidatus Cloacimonadota bacterium]